MNGLLALSFLASALSVHPRGSGMIELPKTWSAPAAAASDDSWEIVPPSGSQEVECYAEPHTAAVWGSDTYTGDSDVCTAAVHAGVIRQGAGGTVRIEWGPARRSFAGTERNGVVTSSWQEFPSSFHFPANGRPAPRDETPPAPATMQTWRGQYGVIVDITCNAGDVLRGTVWGSGTYTDDSNPCRAAMHAGLIGKRGGTVVVEIAPGLASYLGSTRHGVKTGAWNAFPGSFTFPDAPAETFPPSGRELLRDLGLLDKTRWFTEGNASWEVLFVSDGLLLATAKSRGRVTARLVGTWSDSDGAVEVRARLYMTSEDVITEYPDVVGRISLSKDAKGPRLDSEGGALGFETLRVPK